MFYFIAFYVFILEFIMLFCFIIFSCFFFFIHILNDNMHIKICIYVLLLYVFQADSWGLTLRCVLNIIQRIYFKFLLTCFVFIIQSKSSFFCTIFLLFYESIFQPSLLSYQKVCRVKRNVQTLWHAHFSRLFGATSRWK